jgi:hypothetical protein
MFVGAEAQIFCRDCCCCYWPWHCELMPMRARGPRTFTVCFCFLSFIPLPVQPKSSQPTSRQWFWYDSVHFARAHARWLKVFRARNFHFEFTNKEWFQLSIICTQYLLCFAVSLLKGYLVVHLSTCVGFPVGGWSSWRQIFGHRSTKWSSDGQNCRVHSIKFFNYF